MSTFLKQFRTNLQISQREIAESIGIDQRQWSRYESGRNEFPIRYLIALCDHYKVSADYILGREKPQP